MSRYINKSTMDDLADVLDEQLKKISKKGDISPTEAQNACNAMKILYYAELVDAMDRAEQEGYSTRVNPYSAYGYYRDSNSYGDSYNSYENMSHRGNSQRGSDGMSNDGMNNARRGRDGDGDGRYSERRGRDAMGRYTSRDYDGNSRHTEKDRMMDKIDEMRRKVEMMPD